MSDIANNLKRIREKIKTAASAGVEPALIAVSKGNSVEDIQKAIAAGQLVFGENRVQEAKAKFIELRAAHNLELHLIGPLQSNKAEDAVKLFDVIQTLDRPSLIDALVKAIAKVGRSPSLMIEINIGHEPQKAGIPPGELLNFLALCRQKKLGVIGIMCIPPHGKDARGYFLQMKKLAEQAGLKRISMGMSADFEEAVRCGATDVRVGTAIFGERLKKE